VCTTGEREQRAAAAAAAATGSRRIDHVGVSRAANVSGARGRGRTGTTPRAPTNR